MGAGIKKGGGGGVKKWGFEIYSGRETAGVELEVK